MADLLLNFVIDKEFERKRAYDIVRALEQQHYDLKTSRWGARAFAHIACAALTTQNAQAMADFLDDAGCEAIMNILNQHGEMHDDIVSYCCLAIAMLASTRELKEFFGDIGICDVLIYVISMHFGVPEVSDYGSRAIAALAKNNISNSYKLSNAGACETLSQLGNFGFSLRDDRCLCVAIFVVTATSYLSEAVNSERIAQSGLVGLVVELTKVHHKHFDYACAAVKAFCSLASLNMLHREELGKCGGCELLIDMMLFHDTVEICLDGCEAIMHLSLSPTNADKLGSLGVCEIVQQLLQSKLLEENFGAEVCTGAMLHLCTHGKQAKQRREEFIRADISDALRDAQFSPKASYKARENISNLCELLGVQPQVISSNNLNSIRSNNFISQDNLSSPSKAQQRKRNSSKSNRSRSSTTASRKHFHASVIHGSEMVGDTVPLQVEVFEEEIDTADFDDDANYYEDDDGLILVDNTNNHGTRRVSDDTTEADADDELFYDTNHTSANDFDAGSRSMSFSMKKVIDVDEVISYEKPTKSSSSSSRKRVPSGSTASISSIVRNESNNSVNTAANMTGNREHVLHPHDHIVQSTDVHAHLEDVMKTLARNEHDLLHMQLENGHSRKPSFKLLSKSRDFQENQLDQSSEDSNDSRRFPESKPDEYDSLQTLIERNSIHQDHDVSTVHQKVSRKKKTRNSDGRYSSSRESPSDDAYQMHGNNISAVHEL